MLSNKVKTRPYYSVMNSTRATQGFPANHKASSEQKNRSSFVSDQIQMRGQIWLEIDAKGNVKVVCDASIYGKVLFIFITEKANKYFLHGGPNVGLEC